MEQLIELSQTEIKLAFVASCIEGTARALHQPYQEIFDRMKRIGMIYDNSKMFHIKCRERVKEVLMEQNQQNDPVSSPEIQEMILCNCIGQIAAILAKRLDVDPERALELFYASKTCEELHDKRTGLYLFGNLYIAENFMRENEY